MNTSTYLRRLSRLLILGAAIAGATASVAAAVGRPPDVSDAARTNETVPDVFERYAATHPYGNHLTTPDVRPPDVQDNAAALAEPSTVQSSTAITRPPDIRDAAYAAETVSAGQGDGFDWGDYAIGIGSGIGLSLLLAGALGAGLQRRGRIQTA
jgi:hypothetical protein